MWYQVKFPRRWTLSGGEHAGNLWRGSGEGEMGALEMTSFKDEGSRFGPKGNPGCNAVTAEPSADPTRTLELPRAFRHILG